MTRITTTSNLLFISVFTILYFTDSAGSRTFENGIQKRRIRQAQGAPPSVRPEWMSEWPSGQEISETARDIIMENILPSISEEFSTALPKLVAASLKTSQIELPNFNQVEIPYPVQTIQTPKVSFIYYTTPKRVPGQTSRYGDFFQTPSYASGEEYFWPKSEVPGLDPPISGKDLVSGEYESPPPALLQQTREKPVIESPPPALLQQARKKPVIETQRPKDINNCGFRGHKLFQEYFLLLPIMLLHFEILKV